jgi:hypothetical protein
MESTMGQSRAKKTKNISTENNEELKKWRKKHIKGRCF